MSVNRLVRPLEEVALRGWTDQNPLWLDEAEFTGKWEDQGRKGESEHELYLDEPTQRWFKRNNFCYHGNWLEYFHRIALQNWLFPSTGVRFEGLMDVAGELQPVISQPHVRSIRGATAAEVRSEMKRLDFEPIADPAREHDFINRSIGVEVADLHDENVVVGANGILYFIDPIPMMDESSKIERLLREVA